MRSGHVGGVNNKNIFAWELNFFPKEIVLLFYSSNMAAGHILYSRERMLWFQLVWRNSWVSNMFFWGKVDAIFDHFWQLDEYLLAWNAAEVFSGSDPLISKILKTKTQTGVCYLSDMLKNG